MFCPKCGNQLKDGVLFCRRCGSKVDNANMNIQTENTKNAKTPMYTTEGMQLSESGNIIISIRRRGLIGKVFWFNLQKGFGFIKATIDTYPLKIFVMYSDINNFPQNDITDSVVIFDLAEHVEKHGFKAFNVTVLQPEMTKDPF